MMPWNKLEDQQQKANKVLGNGATMPDEPVDVQAIIDKADDSFAKFTKGRADLGNQVESLEDAIDAIKNGMKRVQAAYATADFGLDKKKKDDAKKIDQAHKIFSTFFAQQLTLAAKWEKDLDEMQKHLAQLGEYKGPGK
jgi:uncharacterized phage infection (PIP) family protein YhgE